MAVVGDSIRWCYISLLHTNPTLLCDAVMIYWSVNVR